MTDAELHPSLVAFLRAFPWAEGKIVLTTLTLGDKDGKNKQPCTQVWDVADADKAATWSHDACFGIAQPRNVYFTANGLRDYATVPPKKLSEAHIHAVEWLIVDLDARAGEDLTEERARLAAFAQDEAKLGEKGLPGLPTFAVMTGNGVQLCYRLREPFVTDGDKAKIADVKLYGKGIENALVTLGADDCHSIEHLFRLPFTRNNPDAKKAKKGRIPIMACLLGEPAWDRVYDLAQFESFKAQTVPEVKPYEPQIDPANVAGIAELPETIEPLGRIVIAQGTDPDNPTRFSSRSEALHYACCAMVRGKLDDTQMYSIITDRLWPISASVVDKGRGTDGYARRQIQRAREREEQDFDTDKNGRPYPSIKNVRLALHKMGAELCYDEFADRNIIEGLPGFGPVLQDDAVIRLWLRAEEEYKVVVGKDRFYAIIADCARQNVRNPVVEYLESLKWDGKPRIATWLPAYLGTSDTKYTRAIGRLVLVAAVRRARQPGCKFDEMLVLEGGQGSGKSTALKVLAVREDWFTEDLILNADTKKQIEQTNGKWIVEAGELKGMRSRQTEFLKSFLSRQTDGARMSYGRLPQEYPRRFIIIGTTNDNSYLQDNTGNRRFWPVATGQIDLKALRADRDQLWAEAAQGEAQGESIRLDPALYSAAAAEQGERYERHPWCDLLEAYVLDEQGKVSRDDLWEFLGTKGIRPTGSQTDGNKLSAAMQELGFTREKRMRFKGKPAPVPGFWRGTKDREIAGHGFPDTWPEPPSAPQEGTPLTPDGERT